MLKTKDQVKSIGSVEDLEKAMKELALVHFKQQEALGEINGQMSELKEKLAAKTKPFSERIAALNMMIENYCTEQKAVLFNEKKRSLKLQFGQVGFKASKALETTEKTLKILLSLPLKVKKMYLKMTPAIDKAALKKAPAEELKKYDAKIVENENFFCKPNQVVSA